MIDLYKVYMPDNLNFNEIKRILQSGKLTSGNYVKDFEKKLRNYIGNPYLMVTGNNTYASLIALACLEVDKEDEIISSPMACLASNMPILNFGAKIVWADIDPDTGTLDPESVKTKISSRTKAILHYHWCGYPGYIDEINNIGKCEGVPVIDDAIESFGSSYKNNCLGNVGSDITIFSFQTVRLPNSIDGGALAFRSKELYEKALRIRDFGIDRRNFRDEWNEISPLSDIPFFGYNAIMNELNAFVGSSVIDKTRDLINKQSDQANFWDKYCEDNNFSRLNSRKEIKPNYWVYSFKTTKQLKTLKDLRLKGYYASKVHLRNDYYSCFGSFQKDLIGVKSFSEQIISVPCGWWLKND